MQLLWINKCKENAIGLLVLGLLMGASLEVYAAPCDVKFAGVEEDGGAFGGPGFVRPGAVAVFRFANYNADDCGNLDISILGSKSLHGGEDQQEYNSLFRNAALASPQPVLQTTPVPLTPQASSHVLRVKAPPQIGFFVVTLEFKQGATTTQHFEGIPFEVTCSDGVFCNGEEKFVKGLCQIPNSPDVVPPCERRANPLLGCSDGACDCYLCDETNNTCSQFPKRAYEKVCENMSCSLDETALVINTSGTDLAAAYIETCGGGVPENYCAYECKPDCGRGSKAHVCGSDGCGGICGDYPQGVCPQSGTVCKDGQCVAGTISPGSLGDPLALFKKENQTPNVSGAFGRDPEFAATGTVPTQNMTRAEKLLALESLTDDAGRSIAVPLTGATLTIYGNNAGAQDEVTPATCNSPGVPELIYQFKIRNDVAFAQSFGAISLHPSGDPAAADTVLGLMYYDENNIFKEFKPIAATDVLCSDDAAPPGGYGSHIYGALPAGTYYLIATSYASQAAGPFQIQIKFGDASGSSLGNPGEKRASTCVNKNCGNDEVKFAYQGLQTQLSADDFKNGRCGFDKCASTDGGLTTTCNLCADDTVCSISGQCQDSTCPAKDSPEWETYAFNCKNRQCGTDAGNCGYECGECASGKVCNFDSNQCVPVKACDPNAPVCGGNKSSEKFYCGYDCQWHKIAEPVFDIVPSAEGEVTKTIRLQQLSYPTDPAGIAGSCAIQEGCVLNPQDFPAGAIGSTHYVMRFTTNVHNLSASAGFKPDSPVKRPDLFEFSPCHGHFHFEGFARFDLLSAERLYLDGDHTPVVRGGKLAYCMEDTLQYSFGTNIGCAGLSTCDNQGIQPGWTDRYPADLDCQWIDLSYMKYQHDNSSEPVFDKWYAYRVCVNTDRNFVEASYDNNCKSFLVYLPDELITATSTMNYEQEIGAGGSLHQDACVDNAQLETLVANGATRPCICTGTCKDVTLFDAFVSP